MKKSIVSAMIAAILFGVCLFNFSACDKGDPAYDVYLVVECYYMREDTVEPMYGDHFLEKKIIIEKDEIVTDSLVLRAKGYYHFWVKAIYHEEPEYSDNWYTKVDILDSFDDRISADVQNDKESPYVFMQEVPIHSYRGTVPARYALRLNIVPFEVIEEGEYRDKLLEEMK